MNVWNLKDGMIASTLNTPNGQLAAIAVTPDGQRAIAISYSGTLTVWDLEHQTNLLSLENIAPMIARALITRDCQRVLCLESDPALEGQQALRIRNVESGQILHTLEIETSSFGAIALSPSGQLAVSASWNQTDQVTVRIWDLASGEERDKFYTDDAAIGVLTFTPDERLLIAATDLSSLKIWDLATCTELSTTLHAHILPIDALSVTPDGKRLLSASLDGNGTFKIWNLERIGKLSGLSAHSNRVTAIAITPDGKQMISAATDNTVKVWNLENGTVSYTFESQPLFVNRLAVTPDSKRASAATLTVLIVWNLETREVLHTFDCSDLITAAVITPDGEYVISAAEDNTIRVWNLENGLQVQTWPSQNGPVKLLVVTPDGSRLIATNGSAQQADHTINVWDLKSGTLLTTLVSDSSVQALALTPDGQKLIVGCLKNIEVWNLNSPAKLLTLEGHTAPITALAIMPDGQQVVSASSDATLKVWDLNSGLPLYELNKQSNPIDINDAESLTDLALKSEPIVGMTVSFDGKQAILHSSNRLKVWNLKEQVIIASFNADSAIATYAVAPDGNTIVVGEASGQLHILRVEDIIGAKPP